MKPRVIVLTGSKEEALEEAHFRWPLASSWEAIWLDKGHFEIRARYNLAQEESPNVPG